MAVRIKLATWKILLQLLTSVASKRPTCAIQTATSVPRSGQLNHVVLIASQRSAAFQAPLSKLHIRAVELWRSSLISIKSRLQYNSPSSEVELETPSVTIELITVASFVLLGYSKVPSIYVNACIVKCYAIHTFSKNKVMNI